MDKQPVSQNRFSLNNPPQLHLGALGVTNDIEIRFWCLVGFKAYFSSIDPKSAFRFDEQRQTDTSKGYPEGMHGIIHFWRVVSDHTSPWETIP